MINRLSSPFKKSYGAKKVSPSSSPVSVMDMDDEEDEKFCQHSNGNSRVSRASFIFPRLYDQSAEFSLGKIVHALEVSVSLQDAKAHLQQLSLMLSDLCNRNGSAPHDASQFQHPEICRSMLKYYQFDESECPPICCPPLASPHSALQVLRPCVTEATAGSLSWRRSSPRCRPSAARPTSSTCCRPSSSRRYSSGSHLTPARPSHRYLP